MLRPPVALESISRTDTGNVRIEFKQATSYGKTSTEISPRQRIARLSALVSPPHFNVIRYRGDKSLRGLICAHASSSALLTPNSTSSNSRCSTRRPASTALQSTPTCHRHRDG